MQRIQYHQYGGPDVMRMETYELPALGKREVLVRVKAASINPLDWKLRQGFMKLIMGRRFPRAMGIDFSGVIEAVGPEVTDFSVGDAVLGWTPMTAPGAFAEAVITTSDLVIKKPPALSFPEAAVLPSVGVTAWRALIDVSGLKAGQSVFINGAAGGVGQAAIAIAKSVGAAITVRVGSSAMTNLSASGFTRVLDYSQALPVDLAHNFEVVFDCHGSLTADEEEMLIKPSGVAIDIDPTLGNLFRSLTSSKHRMVRGLPSQEILAKVLRLAVDGLFPIAISRTAPLSGAIALITDLESGKRSGGKAVILMENANA